MCYCSTSISPSHAIIYSIATYIVLLLLLYALNARTHEVHRYYHYYYYLQRSNGWCALPLLITKILFWMLNAELESIHIAWNTKYIQTTTITLYRESSTLYTYTYTRYVDNLFYKIGQWMLHTANEYKTLSCNNENSNCERCDQLACMNIKIAVSVVFPRNCVSRESGALQCIFRESYNAVYIQCTST